MTNESPDNSSQSPAARRGQTAGLWIAACLAAVLIVLAYAYFTSGSRSSDPVIPSLTGPPPTPEQQALDDQLAELGDLFGQVMEHNRDVAPLIERIDALLSKHPDLAAGHTLRGQTLMFASRLDEALQALERSLAIEPEQAGIHQLAGAAAEKLDRLEAAREHYEAALRLQPDSGSYAIFLANAQHKLDRDYDAIPTLTGAIQRNSKLHGAYALLSDIYASQDKPDAALAQIDRALNAVDDPESPVHVVYTIKRAAVLRLDDQPAESLAALTALPAMAQLRPDVMRDVAESWDMLGKPAMAASHYEQALGADPSNDHAAAQAVHWWLKAGDAAAAGRNLKTLRRINPRHPNLPRLDAEVSSLQSE